MIHEEQGAGLLVSLPRDGTSPARVCQQPELLPVTDMLVCDEDGPRLLQGVLPDQKTQLHRELGEEVECCLGLGACVGMRWLIGVSSLRATDVMPKLHCCIGIV